MKGAVSQNDRLGHRREHSWTRSGPPERAARLLRRLGEALDQPLAGAEFAVALVRQLRTPLRPGEAEGIVRQRLASRESNLKSLLVPLMRQRAGHPYRRLLLHAGVEVGDVTRLLHQGGVEGTLRKLFQAGVYLRVGELKGREPVQRGSLQFWMRPEELANPLAAHHVAIGTSGTRGPAAPVLLNLNYVRDSAANAYLTLGARGLLTAEHAAWLIPGGSPITAIVRMALLGARTQRWFSQVDPLDAGIHARYRWSARIMQAAGRLAGVPIPAPEYAPTANPLPILDWMRLVLQRGQTPHLITFASSAALLARAAQARGLSLAGAHCTLLGEPLTAARLAAIQSVGMDAQTRYSTIETTAISDGCPNRTVADESHLLQDMHAIIQPADCPGAEHSEPPNALFLTSMRPTAPVVLLNVSLGDQAVRREGACGCPLEAIGWPTRFHTFRSYEKLSAGGVTFLDSDVVEVLEQRLPARFGGGPTDYQLVEEERSDGSPSIRLVVHPAVGRLDQRAVVDAFLAGLGKGPGAERLMAALWADLGAVEVERRVPLVGPTGKVQHLHHIRALPLSITPVIHE